MGKSKLHRRISAALLIALLLTTTTGFRMESHTCIHCGIDISFSIYPEVGGVSDSCCEGSDSSGQDKNSCDINKTSCCSVETSTYELDEPFFVSGNYVEFASAPVLLSFYSTVITRDSQYEYVNRNNSLKYGGRQTVILNSQYRT